MTAAPSKTAQGPTPVLSIISLVAGAASLLFGQTFFLPLTAIILGFIAWRREPNGSAMAAIGIVLGFLMLLGWLLVVVLGVSLLAPLALLHHLL